MFGNHKNRLRPAALGLVALAVAIMLLAPLHTVDAESAVRFAVIGDRTGGHEPGIHGAVLDEIIRLQPDFIINVGDMIDGYVDDSARVVDEWREYDSIMAVAPMPLYGPRCEPNREQRSSAG